MNERIKELAEIARRKPMGNSWTYAHLDEFEQRFAELIVRECAELVRKYNYESIRNDEPYGITFDDIMRHFGVEE